MTNMTNMTSMPNMTNMTNVTKIRQCSHSCDQLAPIPAYFCNIVQNMPNRVNLKKNLPRFFGPFQKVEFSDPFKKLNFRTLGL